MLRVLHLSEQEIEAEADRRRARHVRGLRLRRLQTRGRHDVHEAVAAVVLRDGRSRCRANTSRAPIDTYMMLFAKGTRPGVGARVDDVPQADRGVDQHAGRTRPRGCGLLDFSADLSPPTRVDVPPQAPWVVDWRDVTLDGQGNALVPRRIDGLILAFYEGKTVGRDPDPHLRPRAHRHDVVGHAGVGGRTADLAHREAARHRRAVHRLHDAAGTGVWMLALTCSTCQNPAPVLLTVLDPVAGDRDPDRRGRSLWRWCLLARRAAKPLDPKRRRSVVARGQLDDLTRSSTCAGRPPKRSIGYVEFGPTQADGAQHAARDHAVDRPRGHAAGPDRRHALSTTGWSTWDGARRRGERRRDHPHRRPAGRACRR